MTGPDASPEAIEARRVSFGRTAAAYDAVRPPWPAETMSWLLGSPEDGRSLDVLDLGAGTGLGTRTIGSLGHRVIGLDTSAEMLRTLEESTSRLPESTRRRISTCVAGAEAVPLPDGSLDAVTCLQAWHWFDREQAVAECARLVRTGGRVGLAWQTWDASVPWLRELADVVGQPEMVDARAVGELGMRRAGDDVPLLSDAFDPAEGARFELVHELTPDELVLLATSWSYVAVREDRDEVLRQVHDLGTRVASDGRLAFGYISVCYRFLRR